MVNEDGQQLGVMATDTARDIASRVGLDLVEISANAKPPVCKIMDYGRYKYELKKKASTARRTQHQTQVKEVKFRPRIDEHDLDFKIKNARRFLFEGDKVKCTVMFRGREIVHTQIGRDLLKRVVEELEDVALQESRAQMEGRTLSLTLAPNRGAIEKLKAAGAAPPPLEADDDAPQEFDEADIDESETDETGETEAEAAEVEDESGKSPAEQTATLSAESGGE